MFSSFRIPGDPISSEFVHSKFLGKFFELMGYPPMSAIISLNASSTYTAKFCQAAHIELDISCCSGSNYNRNPAKAGNCWILRAGLEFFTEERNLPDYKFIVGNMMMSLRRRRYCKAGISSLCFLGRFALLRSLAQSTECCGQPLRFTISSQTLGLIYAVFSSDFSTEVRWQSMFFWAPMKPWCSPILWI